MATTTTIDLPIATRTPTIADLFDQFGETMAHRIVLRSAPGTATVEDVISINEREDRLCELVDGFLVEKVMGYYESNLACILIHLLSSFLDEWNLGLVAGEGGMMRLAPNLVRIPDVSFVAWGQFPEGRDLRQPVPSIYPDLAVEVLSASNTPAEMDRKLRDYFEAGTRLVWYLDPPDRTVRVYTAVDQVTVLDESGTLEGAEVLPGFRLVIRDWLARAERPGAGAGAAAV